MPFKISVLIFVKDARGRHLLIRRVKEPNKGCWSPIGGKLEMAAGESPFQCAIREAKEEIGLDLEEKDLHLFSMISEKAYEGDTHWLMFLFDCKKPFDRLPADIDEGAFRFFGMGEILGGKITIPETDKKLLWDIWQKCHESGQIILRADCGESGNLTSKIEQVIK